MADDTPSPDQVQMAGRPLSDQTLERMLGRVAEQQKPDPAFAEQMRRRLHAPAMQNAAITPPPGRKPRLRPNRRWPQAALLAFGAAAAAVWALAPRAPVLPPLPAFTRTLAADSPVVMRAPDGRRVGVRIAGPANTDLPLLDLELRDGAEVTFRPSDPPRLELAGGFMRVVTRATVVVQAGPHQIRLESGSDVGSDVALEMIANTEGENTMRTVWLIPTSAASGAALTLAILVAQGRVALSDSTRTPPAGEVMVLKTGEPAGPAPGQAHRRLVDLERKVSSLQQENGRLAGQLARRKGVTIAKVREQFAALKRTALPGLAPGAQADLVSDLKGMGEEGVNLMLELLKSGDEKERFLAANLLEQLNAPAAIPGLRQAAMNDPDKWASTMAGHALALMDDAATVPALREIADANKTWESKVNALWGLCKHGDQRAMTEALALVKDPKQSNQLRAALGANLMLLPDPELLPIVDETLRQFSKEEQVAMLGIEYYKAVGTPEAHSRLAAMAADSKLPEAVRTAARNALSPSPKPAQSR